jgi:hypothetical protein
VLPTISQATKGMLGRPGPFSSSTDLHGKGFTLVVMGGCFGVVMEKAFGIFFGFPFFSIFFQFFFSKSKEGRKWIFEDQIALTDMREEKK